MTLKGTLIGRSLRCEEEGDCGIAMKIIEGRTGFWREIGAGNDGKAKGAR